MSCLITESRKLAFETSKNVRCSWDMPKNVAHQWMYNDPFISLLNRRLPTQCPFCRCFSCVHLRVTSVPPEYAYLRPQEYCWECLVKAEETYIKGMPLTRLPLRINHVWVTYEAEKFFFERFSGVSCLI